MNTQLSEHFTYKKLFRFTFSAIIMMVFTSIYGVVDGFFVSNYVGKTSFTAVNFIMPFLMMLGAVGFMFGTGGSALIAKTLGEGKNEKAKQLFSLFTYTTAICGVIIAVLGILFIKPIAALLGAEGKMLGNCVTYGRIILVALPFYMLQYEFQSFFATAEKPQIGLGVTIAAGCTNMILDALFVAIFKWELVGAAAATAISQLVGGIIPLIYFSRKNSSILRFVKTQFDRKSLFRACANGSSELMTNISMSIVNMLYNVQLIKYAGEDGVAAYGVLMYVNMIFLACLYRIFSRNSSDNRISLRRSQSFRIKKSSEKKFYHNRSFFRKYACPFRNIRYPLAKIFVGYDKELLNLTLNGFRIFSFVFIFAGISIFGSSFFTSLNNGLVSALISFLRTLVFQVTAVMIIPIFLGINGIWLSIVTAEIMSVIITLTFIFKLKGKYHYM